MNEGPISSANTSLRPSAVPWPPLLLVGTVGLGIGLNYLAPLPLSGNKIVKGASVLLAVTALTLDVSAVITLLRHETTPLPNRGSKTLVTSGPFGLSRNPIYVGNVMLTTSLALALANAWLLIGATIEVILLKRLAIIPEEKHLGQRFGDAWVEYRERTPRWLGPTRRDK